MINLDNFSSIFVANWKLNGNTQFIKEYYQKLTESSDKCIVICSPSIFLNSLYQNNINLFAGAQDISSYNNGAYTGELSATMLSDINIKFCIVGHSERRNHFNEDNKIVNLKTINLIENNIIPIVCIGETLHEKEKNLTMDVLSNQILESIPSIANHKNTIIAYEPIWAIGTGLTPSLDDIEEVHLHIKKIGKRFNQFRVLYGGSVKPSNSANINALKNVDGCLIGGASLKVNEFNSIIS